MSSRVFTDEDREWLKDNYPHLSNKKCIEHFRCGYDTFKRLVEDCGLTYRDANKYAKKNSDVPTKNKWQDKICGGYCIDCQQYVPGGSCSQTGKAVGALWQKKCFK